MTKEIRKDLRDLKTLSENEKEMLERLLKIAFNDFDDGEKNVIAVSSDIEKELEAIERRKDFKKPKNIGKGKSNYELFKETNVSEEIKKTYESQVNSGDLKRNHIYAIRKADSSGELSSLRTEDQLTAIGKIIESINKRNSKFTEEISTLHLKAGNRNQFNIDNWYSCICRLIKELQEKIIDSDDLIEHLSIDQKRHLSDQLKELIPLADGMVEKL
ncbi:MAG: hypothetical protein APF76_18185 [Desulfitibacter sp. BRH_c19]|nr:MAG: hypothetical protein APF76_18185 [Desulfitibacter sp. BRH_c19]